MPCTTVFIYELIVQDTSACKNITNNDTNRLKTIKTKKNLETNDCRGTKYF